jgi:hypothetical protein
MLIVRIVTPKTRKTQNDKFTLINVILYLYYIYRWAGQALAFVHVSLTLSIFLISHEMIECMEIKLEKSLRYVILLLLYGFVSLLFGLMLFYLILCSTLLEYIYNIVLCDKAQATLRCTL